MKLYYFPLSTYCQKVMIAFEEKGVTYEPEPVDFMTPEGRAAYEETYPIGKVPFLKATEDWDVPESTSIIEYLEDKFPDTPRLIRVADEETARQVRFMDRMSDLYYNDQVTELLFQHTGFRPKDEDRAARARKLVDMTYFYWDRRLAEQPWLCGEHFTMADCAAIPSMFYARTVVPFDEYQNVAAYWERAQARPSYAKVRAGFEPIWNEMVAGREVA